MTSTSSIIMREGLLIFIALTLAVAASVQTGPQVSYKDGTVRWKAPKLVIPMV